MFKEIFKNFIIRATDWFFRPKKIEYLLIRYAFGVIIIVLAAPPLIVQLFQIFMGHIPANYENITKVFSGMDTNIIYFCFCIIIAALTVIFYGLINERRSSLKKRVIVVEGRGLRDDDGSPLVEQISKKTLGQRNSILLDLRKNQDGIAMNPEHAISRIEANHISINQQRKAIDKSELSIVYGGLTSVPFTFLTGVMMDDEGKVITYDWDRTKESWRELDDLDDGVEFSSEGINNIGSSEDIVIALTYSYPIIQSDLDSTFNFPIVKLTLNKVSSDSHWSEEKQSRLAQQFLETIKEVSNLGVKRIHLVMAAPNSVVFNFGRRYDKRNLPEIIVYQFERGENPAYPWGINMPVSGLEKARVIYMR